MRVVYVNHTAYVSGAEQSLLTLLGALPADVEPTVACPEGPLAARVRELGVPVETVPGTAGSLKLHPWHTPRAVAELGAEAVAVRRLARRVRADLIHANTVRAGIAACIGGGTPVVVQVRDCLPAVRTTAVSLGVIDRRARLVLANSRFTERCFSRTGSRAPTGVLCSPVDMDRFSPGSMSRERARARLDLGPETAVLAVLAQITPWKGQDTAIRLVASLRERFPDIRLLLVGAPMFVSAATRHDNTTYTAQLEGLVGELGVGGQVAFLGERADVPELLRATDLLLVPSWEEPFGRSVVEAMAMEVPVLATSVGGPSESVRDGVDGFLLPPREPDRWVGPATELLESADLRLRMGRAGRQRVIERFAADVLADELLGHYRTALAPRI